MAHPLDMLVGVQIHPGEFSRKVVNYLYRGINERTTDKEHIKSTKRKQL